MAAVKYCIPGTMCDEEIWAGIKQCSSSPASFVHVPIPRSGDIDTIVENIAEQLPEDNISLVGFSLGGYLASLFASRYPERISQLFIMSNSPCALPNDEVSARRESVSWIQQVGYRGLPDGKIRTLLDERHHQNTGIFNTIKRMENRLGVEVFLQQLQATTEREDLLDSFCDFSFPVTFCFGESDILVNRDWIKRVLAENSLIKKSIVRGAGHMLPLEDPSALAQLLDAW